MVMLKLIGVYSCMCIYGEKELDLNRRELNKDRKVKTSDRK